jgi:peptidoglycan/LPS O-acetylase OafA/YrhL
MSRRSRNAVRILILLAAVASVWLVSSEPWGLGVEQLLMFAAPGALLGLGASWAAHGSTQRQWTWKNSRRAALVGALALPPVLAFVVAWEGNARPQRLLVGFVYAAWLVLIGGGVIALVREPTTGR